MIDGAAHGSSHTQHGHHNDANRSVGGGQQCRSGCSSDASTPEYSYYMHRRMCSTHSPYVFLSVETAIGRFRDDCASLGTS